MREKNRKKYMRIALLIGAVSASCAFAACAASETRIAFEQSEYVLYSGEKINALCNKKDVLYGALTPLAEGVTLDETSGAVTFDESVPDGYQFLVYAEANGTRCNPVVCTLKQPVKSAEYSLESEEEYYVDGAFIRIAVTPAYAISYKLATEVGGVSLNSVTGEFSIDRTVADGTECGVQAVSKGGASQVFKVKLKTRNTIISEYDTQIREKDSMGKSAFVLDFSASGETEIVGVSVDGKYASDGEYVYDAQSRILTVKGAFFQGMATGEYRLYVHTKLHSVPLTVKIADKIITTPEEIQEINRSVDSLAGYYILDKDIDLSAYLSEKGAGYDGGKGWKPIGVYLDKPSPYNVEYAFTGTFDGNGHVVKNLKMNRGGDASGFNCGFFGYAKAGAVVKNIGLDGGEVTGNSYCGALIGVSFASVSNVWSTCKVTATKNASYKWIGGIAGRNAGSIKNSFVAAEIAGSTETGIIAGNNQGTVSNCYGVASENTAHLVGVGTTVGSKMYSSESEMIADHIFAGSDGWLTPVGKLPALKIRDYAYYPRKIEISAEKTYLVFGEKIQIETVVYPSEQTVPPIYSVDGKGITIDADGNIDTSAAKCLNFTVYAVLQDCVAEKTFYLYETPQAVVIENEERVLFAGTQVMLLGKVKGEYARQDLSYKITEGSYGVSLDGNILNVSEYAKDGQVKVKAWQDGLFSEEKVFEIRALKDFAENTKVLIAGAETELTFVADGTINKVLIDGKTIDCVVTANKAIFTEKQVKALGRGAHNVVIITNSCGYKAYIKICDKIISTKEDFLAVNASAESLSRYYVLMSDLDFSGEEIKAAGKYDTPYQPFSGLFDGNGHTIKNAIILANTNENVGNYYNLGLFGYVTGKICNLRIENINVRGANFIGGLCGALGKGGVIENCLVKNCAVQADAPTQISGTIAGRNNGRILYCSYDGDTSAIGQSQSDGYEEGLEKF